MIRNSMRATLDVPCGLNPVVSAVTAAFMAAMVVSQAPTAQSRPDSAPSPVHVSGRIVTPAGFPVEWTKMVATTTLRAIGQPPRDVTVGAPLGPGGEWKLGLTSASWQIDWAPMGLEAARMVLRRLDLTEGRKIHAPVVVAPRDIFAVEVTDTDGRAIRGAAVAAFDPASALLVSERGFYFAPSESRTDELGHAIARATPSEHFTPSILGVIAPGFRWKEVPLTLPRMRVTLDRAVPVRLTLPRDFVIPTLIKERRVSAALSVGRAESGARLPHHWITIQGGREPAPASRQELRALMTPGDYAVTLTVGHELAFDKMANPYARCEHLELLSRVTIPDTRDEVEIAVPIDPADLAAALERLAKQK